VGLIVPLLRVGAALVLLRLRAVLALQGVVAQTVKRVLPIMVAMAVVQAVVPITLMAELIAIMAVLAAAAVGMAAAAVKIVVV
jgi:hypothetical protein